MLSFKIPRNCPKGTQKMEKYFKENLLNRSITEARLHGI